MNISSIFKSGLIGWIHEHIYLIACWLGHAIFLTEEIEPCDIVIRTHEEYLRNRNRIISGWQNDVYGLSFDDIASIIQAVNNYEITHNIKWKCASDVDMIETFNMNESMSLSTLWILWFRSYVLNMRMGDY